MYSTVIMITEGFFSWRNYIRSRQSHSPIVGLVLTLIVDIDVHYTGDDKGLSLVCSDVISEQMFIVKKWPPCSSSLLRKVPEIVWNTALFTFIVDQKFS